MCSKFLLTLLLVYFISPGSYAAEDKSLFRRDYTYIETTESFYKFHRIPSTWVEAKRMCEWEGAALFYPKDDDEAFVIFSYWNETHPTFSTIYVGISDLIVEGTFVTIDGKPESEVYNNWYPGEPNDLSGEDCVVLNKDEHYNDISCVTKISFICKKKLQHVEWNRLCNIPNLAYVYSESERKCYKYHNNAVSWTDAFKICYAEQAHLAVINSESEKDYLLSLIPRTKYHSTDVSLNETIHLGFHNRIGEGWRTIHGTTLDVAGYAIWAEGQPDGKDENKQCGSISHTGLLNDISCNKKSSFICEHDVDVLSESNTESISPQLSEY